MYYGGSKKGHGNSTSDMGPLYNYLNHSTRCISALLRRFKESIHAVKADKGH